MKQLFLSILLFAGAVTFAQNFKVAKSPIFKDKKKYTQLLYSEEDGNGGIVTVRVYYAGILKLPKGYYIDHYDSKLKHKGHAEIEVDKSFVSGLMVKDGVVRVFENQKGKEEFNVFVYESQLDKLNFSTKKEILSLDKSDMQKDFGVVIGVFLIDNFDRGDSDKLGLLTFSKNKNYMVVNFDIKDKDNEVHRIFVFNDKLEKVYDTEFKKDIKDRYFDYKDITVSDTDGSVYFLGKVFEGNSRARKKKGKTNYHYELFRINADGQKNVSFKSEEHFTSSLYLLLGKKNIYAVGFYSDKKDNRYKGVVRYNINQTNLGIEKTSFQPFTEQFILDKYGKNKEKELKDISFRGVFLDEANEDIIINGEEFFITTHYDMNTHTTRTTFHYYDIISTKIDKSGKLLWARNINKKQRTGTPVFSTASYSSTLFNNKVFIFLNGSEKIKKIKNDRIQFKGAKTKKLNLYAITIDENGDFDYKIIQTSDQLNAPPYVSNGIINKTGDELIFLTRRKKEKQFLKVRIN